MFIKRCRSGHFRRNGTRSSPFKLRRPGRSSSSFREHSKFKSTISRTPRRALRQRDPDTSNCCRSIWLFPGLHAAALPLLLLPLDLDVAEFQRASPILFLAAVNAASGTFSIEIQQAVNHHLLRIFAERILLAGEKSLELIQAVQIFCIWHYPPARYEALKHYQLVRMSVLLFFDDSADNFICRFTALV